MLWVLAYITGMLAYWFLPEPILSRIPRIVFNCKRQQLRTMWPLTPAGRVDHVLCDSDEKLRHEASESVQYAVMLTPMTLPFWLLAPGPDTHRWLILSLRALAPLLLGTAAIKVRQYTSRYLHRETLAEQIHEERQIWDARGANTKVFVSRRDAVPAAVELFDELVRHLYRHKLTLIQYTDFEWPTYAHRIMGPSQNIYPWPNCNPQSVGMAKVLLWLDFGQTSYAMRLELKEAKRLGLPLVHVSLQDRLDVMTVGEVGGQDREVQRSAVPEAVAQELKRVLAQHNPTTGLVVSVASLQNTPSPATEF